jgi:leucine-rich repeat-containing protein 16
VFWPRENSPFGFQCPTLALVCLLTLRFHLLSFRACCSCAPSAAENVTETIQALNDDRITYACRVTKLAPKTKKPQGPAILVLGIHNIYMFKPGTKNHKRAHWMLWREIRSGNIQELLITFDEGKNANHIFLECPDVDDVIGRIVLILRGIYGSMTDNTKFAIKVDPVSRVDNYATLEPPKQGPCGGFEATYRAVCTFLQSRPSPYLLSNLPVWQARKVKVLDLNDYSHLQARDVEAVTQALGFNKYFDSLSCRTKMPEKSGQYVATSLGLNRGLGTAVLNKTGFSSQAFVQIATLLTKNIHTSLHTLDFSDNEMGDNGVAELAKFVAATTVGLVSLRLSNVGAGRAIGRIGSAINSNRVHHDTLERLDIGKNKLENDSMSAVGIALRYTKKLRQLSLQGVTKGAKGFSWTPVLRNLEEADSVEVLDLSRNNFSAFGPKDPAYRDMISYVRDSTVLVDVNLAHTHFPLDSIAEILRAAGPRLLQLDLSGFLMGDHEVVGLIRAIEYCTGLEELKLDDLMRTKPSKQRGRSIEVIRDYLVGDASSNLQALSMRGDANRGKKAMMLNDFAGILKAFESNSTVVELDVTGQGFGDIGAKRFASVLQMNSTLEVVRFDFNSVTSAGFRQIRVAVQRNTSLVLLAIPLLDLNARCVSFCVHICVCDVTSYCF